MKTKLFLALAVLSLSACQKEELIDNQVTTSEEMPSISLTKDNFLRFDKSSTLLSFLNQERTNKHVARRSPSNWKQETEMKEKFFPEGFESVSMLKDQILENDDMEDDSEMTIDEFNMTKADRLLKDPILAEVMDTTLRIQIGDTIYKVCEYGTFSGTSLEKIESAISNFDTSMITNETKNMTIALNNDVYFTNTFGENADDEGDSDMIEDVNDTNVMEEVNDTDAVNNPRRINGIYDTPTLHLEYNVDSYRWRNHSVWQKFWDSIRGKDVCRYTYFSDTRRLKFEVFQTNYLFYASTGIKVQMQKRRRFLFVKYWSYTKAPKLALGFNIVCGDMIFKKPQPYTGFKPAPEWGWTAFTTTLNNITAKYLYGVYRGLDFPRNWTDEIYNIIPEVTFAGERILNRKQLNSLSDASFNVMGSLLKSMTNKYVYKPIQKAINLKDPKVVYGIWGPNDYHFTKEIPYLMGVKEYNSIDTKTVYFARSGGFIMSFGFNIYTGKSCGFGVSPNVEMTFNISDIDVFGAAYYDNHWKGVRMFK